MMKSLSLALAVLAFVATLAGCTRVSTEAGGPGGGGNPWTQHGLLRMAGLSNPDNLNPVVGNQQIEVDLSMFWAGYLFNWDDRNQFVPELAAAVPSLSNGGISKDGLQITYHLRKGVKWQDGAPFSADDVIYTWQQVMNKENNVGSRVGYELITGIDKKNDYTIAVHLKKPYAPFVATFFTMSGNPFPILPKHLLSQFPNINRVAYNNKPVGTGPFTVVEYQPGVLLRLQANPNYWRGAPKLKEVDYKIVPNETTILTQLKTHEADFEYSAPAAQAPALRDIPGTRIVLTPFTQYRQMALNIATPILGDVRVRQALAYATNQQELIDKVTHGVEMKADTDQPSFLWAYNPDAAKYAFNPAKAGQLLDQAGWAMGPDGYRYKNGQQLALQISAATGSATNNEIELVVQSQWRKVGAKLDVKNYDSAHFFASYGAGGVLQTGKFEIGVYSWVNGIDPDDSTLWMCNQFPPAGQNTYHFCNGDVDAAEKIAITDYDQNKRKAAYDKIQAVLADQEPMIVVSYVRRQDIFNTDFKNYKPAHAVTTFWNTWEWEI